MENYHTHTRRCCHAEGEDRDYVLKAIDEGLTVLGFSDHTPWPFENPGKKRGRMYPQELGDYVSSVRSLRDEFAGKIDIRLGLEVEPYVEYYGWLKELVEKFSIEYLILGSHYLTTEEEMFLGKRCSASDMIVSFENTRKAVETGLFKYICHPDLVFNNYPVFDENCISASRDLLALAQEHRIPVEYNTSGFIKQERGLVKGLGYPTEGFWNIAPEYDVDVYIGFDAHSPYFISRERYQKASDYLKSKGLHVINP